MNRQQQSIQRGNSMKKSARYRAKLKAKKTKERMRKRGFLKVRSPGKRMKPVRQGKGHK